MMRDRIVGPRRAAAEERKSPARPGDVAWAMAVPCALALLLAILVLAAPLGRALFEPTPEAFWPFWQTREGIVPEPAEHAAYLFALLAPVLLAILVLVAARRPPWISPAARRIVPSAAQALGVAFLLACLVAQRRVLYGHYQPSVVPTQPRFHFIYFTNATFVAAGVLALLIAGALSRPGLVAWAARRARETRARRAAATVAAALLTALWLLTAVHSDATVGNANPRLIVNLPFWLDEPFAVLGGHYPLVDFHAQYGQLMAYLAAGAMAISGPSLTAYSLTMVTASCVGMMALFATLRRVVRRSLVALALYVPVLSTSFFIEVGPPDNRYSPGTLFSLFPMRYAGVYAVAWLTARHVDGAWPRRPAVLFFAAGVALVNNIDFGLPAFAAVLAACAAAGVDSRSKGGRLLLEAAAGLAGAFAAVSLLIVATAGARPHFELLLTFPRIYGMNGFGMLPMPSLGLHVVIYATYAAALVLAAVRVANRRRDVLTAMLAWCSVFGLGASAYFVGRSLPEVLISVFSPWALTLALLLVAAARAIVARPSRRPTLAEGAVIAGFALAICSIPQTPAPWTQLERLSRTTARPLFAATPTERAIARWTTPGERVAILTPLSHRIAYRLRLDNVAPYANLESMPLRSQLAETLALMRETGVRRLFLPIEQSYPEHIAALERNGFALARRAPEANVFELAR
jgi:hypothetical protein